MANVILDWDGVVTDSTSTDVYLDLMGETFEELGISMERSERDERVWARWGSGFPRIIDYVLQAEDPALASQAKDLYEQRILIDFPERVGVVPGSPQTLGRLVLEGHELAINSATYRSLIVHGMMPRMDINPALFSLIITPEDLPDPALAKPDPYTANLIMQHMGATRKDTVMVGDSSSDVFTAHNAGIIPIVPLTGNLSEEEALFHDVASENIIPDVTHLPRVLGRLGLSS